MFLGFKCHEATRPCLVEPILPPTASPPAHSLPASLALLLCLTCTFDPLMGPLHWLIYLPGCFPEVSTWPMLSLKPQLKCHLTKAFSDPSISTLNSLSLPTYSYRFDFCMFCSRKRIPQGQTLLVPFLTQPLMCEQ